jgi:hypothetical protein
MAMEVSSNGGWFLTEVARHQGPSATGTLAFAVLNHAVITFNFAAKTVVFAANGVVQAPKAFAGYDPAVAAAQSRIGRTSAYASAFPGVIKDVSLYNYQLSSADIKDLYNVGHQALGASCGAVDVAA